MIRVFRGSPHPIGGTRILFHRATKTIRIETICQSFNHFSQKHTVSNAPEVRLTEEQVREKYPWDYDRLTAECRKRYTGFKSDQKYHDCRKKLVRDKRFSHVRELDPGNPKSAKKPFFNANILVEFDKIYTKA